ncbi:DUF3990 domain-containing protein [Bacillus sp. FJAT-42315]|uniref:DUF3990 domain-containing protein n=1 Tax=Bacillus sp. FJAT-42315 TaxID=2014077 RepID=UPI0012FE86DD|nr:DUF3990 domain-containing protein [Bacillus sp. FJAT-42315]
MSIIHDYSLPLYHGTINIYSDLIHKHGVQIFPRSKGGMDFGPGFYLTTNYEQAKEWAERRATKPVLNKAILELSNMTVRDFLGMKHEFKPIILKFEVENVKEWEQLKYKVFEDDHLDWKKFVWIMRQAKHSLYQYDYDLVYGPVADGGLLSSNYTDIRAYANMDQLAVTTNKALQCLKITEVIECL